MSAFAASRPVLGNFCELIISAKFQAYLTLRTIPLCDIGFHQSLTITTISIPQIAADQNHRLDFCGGCDGRMRSIALAIDFLLDSFKELIERWDRSVI